MFRGGSMLLRRKKMLRKDCGHATLKKSQKDISMTQCVFKTNNQKKYVKMKRKEFLFPTCTLFQYICYFFIEEDAQFDFINVFSEHIAYRMLLSMFYDGKCFSKWSHWIFICKGIWKIEQMYKNVRFKLKFQS